MHGDPHPGNLLAVRSPRPGADSGYVFVDPDGFVADRAYDLGVALREWSAELLGPDARRMAEDLCATLAERSGVDATRIWEWGFLERVSTGLYLLDVVRSPAIGIPIPAVGGAAARLISAIRADSTACRRPAACRRSPYSRCCWPAARVRRMPPIRRLRPAPVPSPASSRHQASRPRLQSHPEPDRATGHRARCRSPSWCTPPDRSPTSHSPRRGVWWPMAALAGRRSANRAGGCASSRSTRAERG